MRPETGTMRFGDNWTGVFLRGDDAFLFWVQLDTAIRAIESGQMPLPVTTRILRSLADLLQLSDERRAHPERPPAQIAELLMVERHSVEVDMPSAGRSDDAVVVRKTRAMTIEEVEHNLQRDVYRAALWFERAEGAGLIYGNGHHMAQALADKAVGTLREQASKKGEEDGSNKR